MLDPHTLEQFGLNSKEAKVYLASIESGSASCQEIAKKAGIHRVSTYDILEILSKKGLISETRKGKKRLFVAEDPDKILGDLKNKTGMLEKLMPELQALFGATEIKPKIKFYEGISGFKTIWENVLKILEQDKLKEYLLLTPTDLLLEKLQEHFPTCIPKRIALGVKLREITVSSELAKERKKEVDPKELRTRKTIPSNFGFTTSIIIYGNHVSLLSLEKNIIGLNIENKGIADTFRNFFEFMWIKAEMK